MSISKITGDTFYRLGLTSRVRYRLEGAVVCLDCEHPHASSGSCGFPTKPASCVCDSNRLVWRSTALVLLEMSPRKAAEETVSEAKN